LRLGVWDGSYETDLINPRLCWSTRDGSAYCGKVPLLFGRQRDDIELAHQGEQLNDLILARVLGQSRYLAKPAAARSNSVQVGLSDGIQVIGNFHVGEGVPEQLHGGQRFGISYENSRQPIGEDLPVDGLDGRSVHGSAEMWSCQVSNDGPANGGRGAVGSHAVQWMIDHVDVEVDITGHRINRTPEVGTWMRRFGLESNDA
jgi:hypothetical protein